LKPAEVIALLEAERPMLDAAIEEAVSDAVDRRFGLAPEPTTPDAAAADILEAVASFHANDLTHAEEALPAALAARLGGDVSDVPEVMVAIEEVLRSDQGANVAALHLLEAGVRAAVRLPRGARDRKVDALLDAERDRLKSREASRLPRLVGNLKAEMIDEPAPAHPVEGESAVRRPGGSITEVPIAC
jgi:hypothetical protein